MRRILRDNTGSMYPGQDLVVAGYAGLEGSRVIAANRRTELLSWFSGSFIEDILKQESVPEVRGLEFWKEFGATECEIAGEGGIFTALWTLSGAYETGIWFSLRKIPIKQATVEICERYDLNPYRLLCKDCCLLTADNGMDLVNALAAENIDSTVIGKVRQGIKREIFNGESEGFMERPQKDELKKVVPDYFIHK